MKGKYTMLAVNNLVKRFGSKFAVDNISFEIGENEVVGILGPNGAGKSTTLNIVTGFLSSTSGTVTVGGFDILDSPYEAKKLLGYLPEQPPLYVDMTVREYLNFVYDLKGCTLNRKKHLAEICNVVKISDDFKKNRLIKNLSKGYKQRVGIAAALVGNPGLIILDEPTVGLDPKEIIEIRNLIRTLGETHSVILSTHILPEVKATCDRVIIFNQGKIVADEKIENLASLTGENITVCARICGPSREILNALNASDAIKSAELSGEKQDDSYLYLIEGNAGIDPRKPLFNLLAKNGWALIGLEVTGSSLEDIFIKLTDKKDKKPEKTKKPSYDIKPSGKGGNAL